MELDRTYWEERYRSDETGWDLGAPSTPLRTYLEQLANKKLRILVPGGGRAYEAEFAHRAGFENVHVIDLTDAPLKDLLERCPSFPADHFLVGDFFEHRGRYDLVLEQTFFCALAPSLRERYVAHMHSLLRPGGKLVGLLFDDALNTDRPPFGGNRDAYLQLFLPFFPNVRMDPCSNSIPPRAGRELWLVAERANPVSCALYDRLEEAATRRWKMHFLLNGDEEREGIIVDLFHRNGLELARLTNGEELELAWIAEMKRLDGEA